MIVGIVCFISLFSSVFGPDSTLVSVSIVMVAMFVAKCDLGIANRHVPFVIALLFLAAGASSLLVLFHPFISLLFNIAFIFTTLLFASGRFEYSSHFPFLLSYVFLQGNPVTLSQLLLRMLSLLAGTIIVCVVYWVSHRNKKEITTTLGQVVKNIDFYSDRFSYCVRMTIGLSLAMLIGQILGAQKAMWISVTVMSLTQITYQQTKQRVWHRIGGTIVGAIFFVLIFEVLLPGQYTTAKLLILSYIYTFVSKYPVQMVFVTMNALAAAQYVLGLNASILYRIIFMLLGIVIALVVNKLNVTAICEKIKLPESRSPLSC